MPSSRRRFALASGALIFGLAWLLAACQQTRPRPDIVLILIDTLLMGDFSAFVNALWHMIMPSFVLSTVIMPGLSRITRASMLEVLRQDYIKTAKAKGLSQFQVIFKHALRNAMIPVVTTIGLQFGVLLGGAILTETIFSWPGIGKWMVDSVGKRDYAVVQGGLMLIASIIMIVNLAVDVLYGFINPRIRR